MTKIIYRLEARGGAKLSRCAESRNDALIIIKLKSPYYAKAFLDEKYIGSIYGSEEKSFRTEPGTHVLKITRSGYKDWERTVSLWAGAEKKYTVELKEEII